MFAIALICIVSASLQPTYAAITKPHMEESSIQYPEPIDQEINEIPDSCKDLTYCTVKPKDYPEEKFNKMFKDYKVLPQPSMIVELKNRQGDPDSTDNCESEVTYEPLYQVREKRDQPWRLVVHAPAQDFVQRVRLERCLKPNTPCFKNLSPSQRFETFCSQKVNVWEVLVVKGDNGTETIRAELPVCCSCHYRELDFKSRFGKPKK